jgi:hypothetical protein
MRGFGILLLALAPAAAVAQPAVSNAKADTRSAASGLAPIFRTLVGAQTAAGWVGYSVPVSGRHHMCCFDSDSGVNEGCPGCRLEGEGSFHNSSSGTSSGSSTVHLEGSGRMRVLFRASGGRVERIRSFSEDCALDAGGLPFHWIDDVRPAESLELLESFLRQADAERRLADGALSAIALHADPAADGILERAVAPGQPSHLRKQAAFWMGNARGRRGYDVLKRLVTTDADDHFREQAIFALSQSEVPEALGTMIDVAHRDQSSHVRGQALFWLAQKAGRRAVQAISDAIRDDPQTEVKKKAVFALSQLPKDEGVPLLIQAARSNPNPVVKKQAMFWLGQSNDPRALAFFEEILTH